MRDKLKYQFWTIITVVLVLMGSMLIYSFSSFYSNSVSNIEALGTSNLAQETAQIENYIDKGLNVLWVTADTVNYMMQRGASNDEILSYLITEANDQKREVDENFTGIYGYINGEYLDGIGWVPPEGYNPMEREWYIAAKEAGGKPTLVSPYLDAQTNTIMMSVSQMLPDGKSVISLDIAMNHIQKITEEIQMEDMGYGFIVDGTGLVVAHYYEEEKGKIYPLSDEQDILLSKVYSQDENEFEMTIDGERCTVFSQRIMDSWYIIMIVSNTKLFHQIRSRMLYNFIVCIIVFIVIFIFCTYLYRKLQKHQQHDNEIRRKLDVLNDNIVKALAHTIDAKDRYTSGHSQRVANYSVAIAKKMGKSAEEQKTIYYAGLLHDVGKIRVSEDVINKPSKLTHDEFEQIKIHPVIGYHILKDIYEDKRISLGAKYHHERYDGKGYPNGLIGDNIPEVARIICVADAYDAMTSNRSYRNALPQKKVREEIENGIGKQFDPNIAKIMLDMMDEDTEYTMRQSDTEQYVILAVDDEKINIKIIQAILKDDPTYMVIGANSGKEALDKIENSKVDLVLLDLVMPDMDGFEVIKQIKSKYDIPVAFLTSDKEIETIIKSTEAGADDYITKPFMPLILKETIHGIMNKWI